MLKFIILFMFSASLYADQNIYTVNKFGVVQFHKNYIQVKDNKVYEVSKFGIKKQIGVIK